MLKNSAVSSLEAKCQVSSCVGWIDISPDTRKHMRRWWVTFRRENVLNLVQRIVTSDNLGVCILVPKRKQDHQHPVQIASGERHKPIESLSGIFGSPENWLAKFFTC